MFTSVRVELGKMPLITFWSKCLGDDVMNALVSSFLYDFTEYNNIFSLHGGWGGGILQGRGQNLDFLYLSVQRYRTY
jgi:hypothetical protein